MPHRSQSTRFARTSSTAVACAALVSTLLVGCQSGGQYDQITREMRMQEDELYALEDYLEQYQQLVCKYRSENAALKRQLRANGVSPTPAAPRSLNGTRPVPTPANGTTPEPEVQPPDIPALEETTSDEVDSNRRRGRSHGRVTQASAEIADDKVAARAVAFEQVDETQRVSEVWLHGEVVANDAGGGPRMVVEVEPLRADGGIADFEGALSLMLTAPNDAGENESIARWDYRPGDVHAAVDPNGESKTIRFHLELPPDTTAADGTQLWVRLLPRHGSKVLAHTAIDLQNPSLFSSRNDMPTGEDSTPQSDAEESPVLAAVYDAGSHDDLPTDESPVDAPPVNSEIFDGGWTIARPGHPAGMPQQDDDANNAWRASMEPPPTVTASATASRPKPRVSRPRETTRPRDVAHSKTPAKAKPTGWSPERSGGSRAAVSRTASARPSWSATR